MWKKPSKTARICDVRFLLSHLPPLYKFVQFFTSTYLNCLNFQTSNKDRSSFWGHQRSLDGGTNYHPNLPDPFDLEEEEVTLEGNSQILSEEDVNFLSQQLPARLVGSVWHLLFSTGKCISLSFFLSSLWFKMEEYHASGKDILTQYVSLGGFFSYPSDM